MGSSVWGAITGGLFGLYDSYQEKRANDRAENLAKDQLEAEKRAQQNEDQARNKANQKQADLAALLEGNTTGGLGNTSLSGAQGAPVDPNRLGKGNTLLGAWLASNRVKFSSALVSSRKRGLLGSRCGEISVISSCRRQGFLRGRSPMRAGDVIARS